MQTDVKPGIEDLVGEWAIDPSHTMVEFTAKHMMISTVRGRFDDVSGRIVVEEDPTKSSAETVIKTGSISTNNPDRDAHLRSPDFLEVEKYPELIFRSTEIDVVSEEAGTFRVLGELTIRDVTRPVRLEATLVGFLPSDLYGKARVAFEASTVINRKDFGLTWNKALETGGVLVGDRVGITLSIAATRQ
jgi:polyisoprenoid-binding protein YceI